MLRLILFFVTVALLAIAGAWLMENDGTIDVVWLGYRIQTSAAAFISIVALLLLLIIVLVEIFFWFKNAPGRISSKLSGDKHKKGLQALTDGFVAIAEGDAKAAKTAHTRAERLLGNQPMALLLGAEAARLEGNVKLTKKRLTAVLENKNTEFLGIKGLLAEAQKEGDYITALELAERAYKKQPGSIWVIPALLELYKRFARWEQGIEVLERACRPHILGGVELKGLNINRERALFYFMRAREIYQQHDVETSHGLLEKAHKLLPDFVPVTSAFASIALELGKRRKAASLVEEGWKYQPHPDLARIFKEIYKDEPAKKLLKRAEKLVSGNANDIESKALVAEIAIKAGRNAKAISLLDAALAERDSPSLYMLRARAEEVAEGASLEAADAWKQKAEHAFMEPAWMCAACGGAFAEWNLICPACGAHEAIEWNIIPRIQGKIHDISGNGD